MGGPGVYPAAAGERDFRRHLRQSLSGRSVRATITSAGASTPSRSALRRSPWSPPSTPPPANPASRERDVSNSPLQALTLLNDQMFMEAAQAMAKQVIAESQSRRRTSCNNIFRRVAPPVQPLRQTNWRCSKLSCKSSATKKLEGEALWAAVSRAALNLDEAITHP